MPRFPWAAWGLLVVVLDLRVGLWDVIPDVVGYLWVVIALAGAEHVARPFLLARSAALAGALASLVTGTPLQSASLALTVAACVVQAAAFGVVLYGLTSGLLETAPEDDGETARWARPLRTAAVALGVLLVVVDPSVYLVSTGSSLAGAVTVLWLVARLAEAVIGVLTVVLLNRVARTGRLSTA
jgi:hypothetical protein